MQFARDPKLLPLLMSGLAHRAKIPVNELCQQDFLVNSEAMLSCKPDGSPALLSTTDLETYTYLARELQRLVVALPREVTKVSAALLNLVVRDSSTPDTNG
jgi:hypothetical protein